LARCVGVAASLPEGSAKLHTQCVFDWNDQRHFLAFARNGSTLAAAKALGVSQSTVHRRLTELEERLGRRLLRRGVTGYRLTELGEELRPLAEQVEGAVAAFERHSASWNKELTGALRVTCPTTVADRLLKTPLIDAFHARYPGLRLEFVLSDLGRVRQPMRPKRSEFPHRSLFALLHPEFPGFSHGLQGYLLHRFCSGNHA